MQAWATLLYVIGVIRNVGFLDQHSQISTINKKRYFTYDLINLETS